MYNAEEYVVECLDSILEQTFQDFEVIVVDDCSTDSSCEIVESYAPKFNGRLRLYHTEKNSGGGGYIPRNLGIQQAKGEYILFVDADDFILLTALETLYKAAKNYDTDVVYTGSYYILRGINDAYLRKDGKGKKLLNDGLECNLELKINAQEENLNELLLGENNGNFREPWSKFVRRDFLIDNKIFFPIEIKTGGDFIWVINVYCHSKRFLRISKPLFFYRRYNSGSVTRKISKSHEKVSYWVSSFMDFAKVLNVLENENPVLSKNPVYCFGALKGHFQWCLECSNDEQLSEQEIYEILRREFAKNSFDKDIAFLLNMLEVKRKEKEESLQIETLQAETQNKDSSAAPAVSVIIPLYNAEPFIGECLDSILNQTFQDFEVIVVDDCSTDNSVAVVESYIEKFDGRLKLIKREKNLGYPGLNRNLGVEVAVGEYVLFVDADDFIMLNALENLYSLAKENDADVVSTGCYYNLVKPNDIQIYMDDEGKNLIKAGLENKPYLRIDEQEENLNKFILEGAEGNFGSPWSKFTRREFLLENKISFPRIPIGEDFLWVINVYCHAKRFLRILTPFYFYRRYNSASITRIKKEPTEQVSHWVSIFIDYMKYLRALENENPILAKNPAYCFKTLQRHFDWTLYRIEDELRELDKQEIYETFNEELQKTLRRELPDNFADTTVPFMFSFINKERRERESTHKKFRSMIDHFTARIDIKLTKKDGDFQILSVSDEEARVWTPNWINKDGIGYQIHSYAGHLEIVAKSTVDGQIQFWLRGIDKKNPEDSSKRIPYWIDYSRFVINDNVIFDTIKSAWHDKPYSYKMKAKANEEIKIQIDWLSYENTDRKFLSDSSSQTATAVSIIIPMYNSEKFIHEALESILVQTFPNYEVIVVDDCSKDNSVEVVKSYIPKFKGRLKLASMGENSGAAPAPRNKGFLLSRGEYIFFMDSDDTLTKTALEEMYTLAKEYNADCVYCEQYYMSEGFGQEYIDKIHITTKLVQKPPFVKKPTFISNNLADRIDDLAATRFWFTPWQRLVTRELLAENHITFPEIIGRDDDVWCFQVLCCAKKFLRVPNACYVRRMYDESFTQSSKKSPNRHIYQWMDIVVRGSLFIDNFMSKIEFFQENSYYRYKALSTVLSPSFDVVAPTCSKLKPKEVYDIFMSEFGKYTNENSFLVSFVFSYLYNIKKDYNFNRQVINRVRSQITARMDIKLYSTKGNFEIVSVSDDKAEIKKPAFLNQDGTGYQIQSYEGNLSFVAKATENGKIQLNLRGMDIRKPDDKTKRIPYWIDYTKLIVNGAIIFDKVTPAWHDKSYRYNMDVKAGEEIKFQIEWLPHRSDT